MRRLLLGASILGFLAFIGVQAVHTHQGVTHDDCQLCMLAAQSVRHVPTTVAAPVPVQCSEPLSQQPIAQIRAAHHRESPARGPPAA
jgi:hypothetical protein